MSRRLLCLLTVPDTTPTENNISSSATRITMALKFYTDDASNIFMAILAWYKYV